jgi:hypothetical protein
MSDPRISPPVDVECVLRAALRMMLTGVDEPAVFTDTVTGHTPLGEVGDLDDLRAQVSDWRDGLTDPELVVDTIAIDGDAAMVRWRLAAQHTGEVLVNEDELFEPTGRHVTVEVTSEFQLAGGRISAFRHDYDLDDLLRQLRDLGPP